MSEKERERGGQRCAYVLQVSTTRVLLVNERGEMNFRDTE